MLKKSAFSASIVPFTVMFPEVSSIEKRPSSLPVHKKRSGVGIRILTLPM